MIHLSAVCVVQKQLCVNPDSVVPQLKVQQNIPALEPTFVQLTALGITHMHACCFDCI